MKHKDVVLVACVISASQGWRVRPSVHQAQRILRPEKSDTAIENHNVGNSQSIADADYAHGRSDARAKARLLKRLARLFLAFSPEALFRPANPGSAFAKRHLRQNQHGCRTVLNQHRRLPAAVIMEGDQWVLGFNKYSHDAGCTLMPTNLTSNEDILTIPKERISRKKHDGGEIGALVRQVLDEHGVAWEDIVAVCGNNHHNRIMQFENQLNWSVGVGIYPESYLAPENVPQTMGVPVYEISHHLAHAWSAMAQAPFERGLIVVMDGMGETLSAMESSASKGENTYVTDFWLSRHPNFTATPLERDFDKHMHGYREAETAYSFDGRQVRRVFKRWVPHRSPPELYNHGFENMESLGALYSRISSHIFGHWNLCGKVMGLAPWADEWVDEAHGAEHLDRPLFEGLLQGKGPEAFRLNWDVLRELEDPNGFKELLDEAGESIMDAGDALPAPLAKRRGVLTAIAARVQKDLEEVTLSFLSHLREQSGENNLIFVGGVAQNSVLNGRIARELGFDNIFIPPCPGDEGISVGCAAFALHSLLPRLGVSPPRMPHTPWTAFQGKVYTKEDVDSAIEDSAPWLEEVALENAGDMTAVIAYAANALADGEIIGWVHGRGEVGARALGHRSILADPTRKDMHQRVNIVKQREQYRPLAPSVLVEEADSWFDGVPRCGSPYMQFTAIVRPKARAKLPAITHVDGSARLQTVNVTDAPIYHELIKAFGAISGVPVVLDTSFNLAGMPIVESPSDAILCFLEANPDLSLLVLFGRVFRRRPFPDSLDAVPQQEPSFVSRMMSDSSGSELRVEILVDDRTLLLTDALELELLESCAGGEVTLGELAADVVDETDGEVTEEDVLDRLRHLFDLRLIAFA